jgi:hypothetical protein
MGEQRFAKQIVTSPGLATQARIRAAKTPPPTETLCEIPAKSIYQEFAHA